MRIAFFSDLHIRGSQEQVETDIGSPSKTIALKTKQALNALKPDVIFGLGDLTASGEPADWVGYSKWLQGIEAPLYEVFGNHDRGFLPFKLGSYGEEYFSLLGRVTDTKVLKIGNLIFILLSEEHNPEYAGHDIIYSLGPQRLDFLQRHLQQLTPNYNVFVLSHSPVAGTTFFSDVWAFNDYPSWRKISRRYVKIFKSHPPIAHLTGHVHIGYQKQGRVKHLVTNRWQPKVGKFLKASNPDMYFLNLPCVDVAHGFVFSRMRRSYVFWNNLFRGCRAAHLYWQHENKGWPLTDWMLKIFPFLKPTVYYIDFETGDKTVDLVTHSVLPQQDVEKYPLDLSFAFHPDSEKDKNKQASVKLIASDLSLRTHQNLVMGDDYWFKVSKDKKATAEFSQEFGQLVQIKKVEVEFEGVLKSQFLWRGSRDGGRNWTEKWVDEAQQLGAVNAVWMKAEFEAGDRAGRDKTAINLIGTDNLGQDEVARIKTIRVVLTD